MIGFIEAIDRQEKLKIGMLFSTINLAVGGKDSDIKMFLNSIKVD